MHFDCVMQTEITVYGLYSEIVFFLEHHMHDIVVFEEEDSTGIMSHILGLPISIIHRITLIPRRTTITFHD